MIYKMELSDSVDTMIFPLLEVPIIDNDVSGIADNTTIDGNIFRDYLWLKKQYIQKWSIMCQKEYEQLRGFWLRQFGNAEVPFYRLFYGDNISTDRQGSTVDGYAQEQNDAPLPSTLNLTQLYGNATQETLSGKNLLNPNKPTSTSHDITLTNNGDGSFNISGTSDAIVAKPFSSSYSMALKAGQTYSISANNNIASTGTNMQVRLVKEGGGVFGTISLSTTNATGQYTPTEDANYYLEVRIASGYAVPSNFVVKPQVELGSEATSWEQFCGGIPSPNPDFPQVVNTVSGAQTVKITGKNIFDINSLANGTITVSDGVATATASQFANGFGQNTSGIPLPSVPSQVSIRATAYTDGNGGTTGNGLFLRAVFTDGSEGTLMRWSNDITTATELTVTTVANKTLAKIYFGYNSTSTNIWHLSNVQIELGSTVTTYEPYQGQSFTIDLDSTELAKIGTYQDYIWNDDVTWKIHKAIHKIVLDGSTETTWGVVSSGTANFYYRLRYLSDCSIANNSGWASDMLSPAPISSSTTDKGAFITSSGELRIRYGAEMSLSDWKDYLKDNNITLYYQAETPTDTEITDSELIEQLNHIYSLYQGTNNIFLIPSAGAQGEMEYNLHLVYDKETDIVPKTPVVLTLTDGGVINTCGCRENIQLIMRETEESAES